MEEEKPRARLGAPNKEANSRQWKLRIRLCGHHHHHYTISEPAAERPTGFHQSGWKGRLRSGCGVHLHLQYDSKLAHFTINEILFPICCGSFFFFQNDLRQCLDNWKENFWNLNFWKWEVTACDELLVHLQGNPYCLFAGKLFKREAIDTY